MKTAAALLLVLSLSGFAAAQSGEPAKDVERIQAAGDVLNEIMSAPDKGIPEEIFSGAKCIAVVPSLKKAGFGFGGQYGRGVASCRTDAGWSAPAFFLWAAVASACRSGRRRWTW